MFFSRQIVQKASHASSSLRGSGRFAGSNLLLPLRSLSVTRGDSVIELHGVTSKLPDGRTLFSDVSLSLLSKTCVGIVGPNGAGKSTLLKLLAGRGTSFEGRVSMRPGTKVTYLAQEPELDDALDVRGNVAGGAGEAAALLKRFEEVNEAMGCEDTSEEAMDGLVEEQASLLTKLDDCGAWDLDARVDRAMAALSLPPATAMVSKLSGGEKRRVALCRALMEQPDVLFLDEPTNHLDAASVAWLETFLREFKGAVVAVTHDRALLEALAEWVVDVEHGQLKVYEGNYSSYLAQKSATLEAQRASHQALKKSLERELEFVNSNRKGGGGAAREKRASEMQQEVSDNNAREAELTSGAIVLPAPHKRLGAQVIEASQLGCTLPNGRKLFRDVSFSLDAGSIVGVVGRNGCGKTTLFNMLAAHGDQDLSADTEDKEAPLPSTLLGDVKVGDSVSMGLVSQSRQGLDPEKTVFEEIGEGEDTLVFGGGLVVPVRAYIASFALKGPAQAKKVGVLSGGERNRVHLAKVLKNGHNVLLLDEPTNDLDVHTLRALEDALNAFPGTAVVISHDRWFLDRICTHTLAFEDTPEDAPDGGSWGAAGSSSAASSLGAGALANSESGESADAEVASLEARKVVYFPGSYSEYRDSKERDARRAAGAGGGQGKGGGSGGGGGGGEKSGDDTKQNKKKKKKKK